MWFIFSGFSELVGLLTLNSHHLLTASSQKADISELFFKRNWCISVITQWWQRENWGSRWTLRGSHLSMSGKFESPTKHPSWSISFSSSSMPNSQGVWSCYSCWLQSPGWSYSTWCFCQQEVLWFLCWLQSWLSFGHDDNDVVPKHSYCTCFEDFSYSKMTFL